MLALFRAVTKKSSWFSNLQESEIRYGKHEQLLLKFFENEN